MRIIIAGGSGFIGRAVTRRLLETGRRATVLSRSNRIPSWAAGLSGVSFAAWDGLSADSCVATLDGADAVINLAGENLAQGRWSAQRMKRLRDGRLDATRALVEAVRRARKRPGVFIQASASGYYGDRGDAPTTEADGPGEGFLATLARDWEEASTGVERLGLRRAVIRSGVVLGADGGALAKMLPPFRLFVGGVPGGGAWPFPWVHLTDEVEAILFLLERPETSGPYNLTAPQSVTLREFCRLLGRVLRRPSFFPVPAFLLRLLYGRMADETLLRGCRAVPARLLEAGYVFRHPEAEEALRNVLGLDRGASPTSGRSYGRAAFVAEEEPSHGEQSDSVG